MGIKISVNKYSRVPTIRLRFYTQITCRYLKKIYFINFKIKLQKKLLRIRIKEPVRHVYNKVNLTLGTQILLHVFIVCKRGALQINVESNILMSLIEDMLGFI